MAHGGILQAPGPVKQAANAMMRATADPRPARLPYFCECGDPDCLRAVWLSPAEYDRRRDDSREPLLSDDHRRPLARVG